MVVSIFLINGVNDCVFVCRVNTADPVSFTLTPPECHMEIRNGYGTSGTRVTGPVHVGDPLTLLILMRSKWGKNSSSPFVFSLNQSRKQAIFQASSLVKLIFYSLDLFWLLLFFLLLHLSRPKFGNGSSMVHLYFAI